jgi:hypothetical protein
VPAASTQGALYGCQPFCFVATFLLPRTPSYLLVVTEDRPETVFSDSSIAPGWSLGYALGGDQAEESAIMDSCLTRVRVLNRERITYGNPQLSVEMRASLTKG